VAEAYEWIFTSVGIHPHDASKVEERHFELMERLSEHPRVLAIGETGLDYHYDNSPREIQREVFRRQLKIAVRRQLPVIVHTREADEDTQQILREAGVSRGVLHCFTSSAALARAALDLGFMISFSGIVTFPSAGELAEIARTIPADRLMIETDCPYLAPIPYRGKRCEPAYVKEISEVAAQVKNCSLEELSKATCVTARELFKKLS